MSSHDGPGHPQGLPEPVENACYEAWYGSPADQRTVAVEQLLDRHPDHRERILSLAARLAQGEELVAAFADPCPPPDIDAYAVLDELGRGGFGAVYRARQSQPVEREVAIKVLQVRCSDPRSVARFAMEQQALARMQHPSIASMLDAGTTGDGRPYLVMELVRGSPLTSYCDEHRLGVSERLRLFCDVCAGVAHAHQRGVVHRDLKPTNILVVDDRDPPQPVIIDFGLAKALYDDGGRASLTIDGAFVGTPYYTSPEQAGSAAVDTRTDVYALGLLLCELLVDDLPHGRQQLQEVSLSEALRIVREEDPRAPSRLLVGHASASSVAERRGTSAHGLLRRVRGDLDKIVLNAVHRDPDQRYSSASALADDVARHLQHLPVAARSPTLGYILSKVWRRHRPVGVAAILLVVAGLLAVGSFVWGVVRVGRAQLETAEQRRVADWRAYALDVRAASLALDQGQTAAAMGHLDATPAHLRGWEYGYLKGRINDAAGMIPTEPRTYALHWVDDHRIAFGGAQGTLTLCTYPEGTPVLAIDLGAEIGKIEATAVPDRLLVGCSQGWTRFVKLVDLSQQTVTTLVDGAVGGALCVSPDGSRYALCEGPALLLGPTDGSEPARRVPLVGARDRVSEAVYVSPDQIIVGTHRGELFRLRADGAHVETLAGPDDLEYSATPISGLAVSRDRGLLFAGSRHRVAIRELDSGRLRSVLALSQNVYTIRVDDTAGVAYVGGGWGLGLIHCYSIDSGEQLGTLDGSQLGVNDLQISADGKRLAAGGMDPAVRVWDLPPKQDCSVVPIGLDCRDLAYGAGGRRAAFCNQDRLVQIIDLDSLEIRASMQLEVAGMTGEHSALIGDQVVVVGWDGVLRAIDAARGTVVRSRPLLARGERANSVSASVDGAFLAVTSYEARTLYGIDSATLETVWEHCFSDEDKQPLHAWIAPDQSEVFCSTYAGELVVFDRMSGVERRRHRLRSRIHDVSWTPRGEALVAGLHTGEVLLLDHRTLAPLRAFPRHTLATFSVCVSPDGQRLATAGADEPVRVLDFSSGVKLIELEEPDRPTQDLFWSNDGCRLFARAHQWDMPSQIYVWTAEPFSDAGR